MSLCLDSAAIVSVGEVEVIGSVNENVNLGYNFKSICPVLMKLHTHFHHHKRFLYKDFAAFDNFA